MFSACFRLGALFACILLFATSVRADRIGYWTFDESSGTTAANSGTGTGLDGTLIGDATFVSGGVFGNAVQLDGAGDYIDIINEVIVDGASSYSVSAWFRPDNIGATRQTIFETSQNWAISTELGAGSNNLTYRIETDGTSASNQTTIVPTANNWHHLYVTYDQTLGETHLYVNGAEVTTFSPPRTFPTGDLLPTDGFHIGTYLGADDRFFSGLIDDVAVWDQTLGSEYATIFWNGGAGNPASMVPESNSQAIIGLAFLMIALRARRRIRKSSKGI